MSKYINDQELPIDGLEEHFREMATGDVDWESLESMRNNIDRDLYTTPREWMHEWLDEED